MQASVSRDPYGAALGAVRRFADIGRFVPGEAIVVTELAAEVGLSATPVREALACLAGEGLIERKRGRGYFYPALSAADVIDLYELQLAYLHAALTLHSRGLGPLRKCIARITAMNGVQALFQVIIGQSDNAALTAAHQRLVDRLSAVLRAERALDASHAPIVQEMIDAISQGDMQRLLALLEEHHDRRCRSAHGFVRCR